MKVKAFLCQHKAEQYNDCEDRFCISPDTKSIAVADGMSQSFLPEYWADLICRKYCESSENWVPTHESVQQLEGKWKELRDIHLKIEEEKKNPFAYLIRNAIADGESAACTFVGVRLHSGNQISYHILGDSSLVVFHDGRLQSKDDIISTHIGEFDSYPDFFDSNHKRGGKGDPINGELTLTNKDTVLFVSDPFSDFFYEKVTSGNDCSQYLKELLALDSHEDYMELVDRWRKTGMHDDDSTVVILQTNGKDKLSIDYEDSDPTQSFFVGKTSTLIDLKSNNKENSHDSQKRENNGSSLKKEKINESELQQYIDKILSTHNGEKHRLLKWIIIFLLKIPKHSLTNKEKKAIKKIHIDVED